MQLFKQNQIEGNIFQHQKMQNSPNQQRIKILTTSPQLQPPRFFQLSRKLELLCGLAIKLLMLWLKEIVFPFMRLTLSGPSIPPHPHQQSFSHQHYHHSIFDAQLSLFHFSPSILAVLCEMGISTKWMMAGNCPHTSSQVRYISYLLAPY